MLDILKSGHLSCRGRVIDKSRKGRCKRFTLVEVTMAIAVIAIGMVGVMGLFPIGFQASRDAVGDNFSSQLTQQFLQMVALQAKAYTVPEYDASGNVIADTGIDGWGNYITGSPQAGCKDINNKITGDKASTSDLQFTVNKSDPFLGNPDFGIYNIDKNKGVYYLESKSGNIVDFSAAVSIWQDDLTYDDDGTGNADGIISNQYGRRLFVEISWPVKVPYDDRQKRYYMLDVFNDHAQ